MYPNPSYTRKSNQDKPHLSTAHASTADKLAITHITEVRDEREAHEDEKNERREDDPADLPIPSYLEPGFLSYFSSKSRVHMVLGMLW